MRCRATLAGPLALLAWQLEAAIVSDAWVEFAPAPALWKSREGGDLLPLVDGRVVLVGGETEGAAAAVFRSHDAGQTWIAANVSAPWTQRSGMTAVALSTGDILVMGGVGADLRTRFNEVWRSRDGGDTWVEMPPAQWSRRCSARAVVTEDDSVVLYGGWSSSGFVNDVWASGDGGRSWALELADAPWRARHSGGMVHARGATLLMGGALVGGDGGPEVADVWRASAGARTWAVLAGSASWGPRASFAVVTLPRGSLLLFGGVRGGAVLDDAWVSHDVGLTWTRQAAALARPRSNAAVALLRDGRVVAVGGRVMGPDDVRGRVATVLRATCPQGTFVRNDSSCEACPDGTVRGVVAAASVHDACGKPVPEPPRPLSARSNSSDAGAPSGGAGSRMSPLAANLVVAAGSSVSIFVLVGAWRTRTRNRRRVPTDYVEMSEERTASRG